MLMHPYKNTFEYLDGYQGMNFVDFTDEAEKVQHESAMEALSNEFPDQEPLVRALYRQKLEEFIPEATIRTFVSIFVTREIKGALNRMQSELH